MKNDINYDTLLDTLDDILDQALKLPLSGGRCMVDEEKLREIIAELRTRTPQEILSARKIVSDRHKIMDEAAAEGEKVIKKAESRANDIVNNDDLTKQARQRADEILASANVKARDIINAAKGYAEDMLKRTEDTLGENMTEIRKTRQNLKNVSAASLLKSSQGKTAKDSGTKADQD